MRLTQPFLDWGICCKVNKRVSESCFAYHTVLMNIETIAQAASSWLSAQSPNGNKLPHPAITSTMLLFLNSHTLGLFSPFHEHQPAIRQHEQEDDLVHLQQTQE